MKHPKKSRSQGARASRGSRSCPSSIRRSESGRSVAPSGKFKLDILRGADACREAGEIGALLRKPGRYSSHLSTWRQERDAAADAALGRMRGPPGEVTDALKEHMEEPRKENEDLRRRLAQAGAIIEVQKRVSEIFGVTLSTPPSEGNA